MGGAEDFGGKAAPQAPVEATADQQAAPPVVSEEDLLRQNHNQRRRTVDTRIGELLVDQPTYYYRRGDSTGTQG